MKVTVCLKTEPADKKANLYGHETARLITSQIGAQSVSDNSNEFSYEGRLVTIRCAKIGNNQIGVTYGMLDRVDSIIAAFEVEEKQYKLIEISPALYKQFMRDSKNEGHVGLLQRSYLEAHGKTFQVASI